MLLFTREVNGHRHLGSARMESAGRGGEGDFTRGEPRAKTLNVDDLFVTRAVV